MTVYGIRDRYFLRFGLFSTRAGAEEWAAKNPLHYFVGIEKRLVPAGTNRLVINEVTVA